MGKGANRPGQKGGQSHKSHQRGLLKHGRNYRWGGKTHSVTKYRSRHGLPPGPRGAKGGPRGAL